MTIKQPGYWIETRPLWLRLTIIYPFLSILIFSTIALVGMAMGAAGVFGLDLYIKYK